MPVKLAGAAATFFILIGGANPSAGQPNPCGLSPRDWCASPAGDPCGRHANERECRADPACEGMRYRGESVVSCISDGRGFWSNCPAVGCVSRRPSGAPPR
jgi:hypothetical protein